MTNGPMLRWWAAAAAAAFCAAAIVACGGGGGSGVGSGGTGNLSVSLTDAPACGYDHVFVTVDRVRVHQDGSASDGATGWSEVVLATPRRLDLLDLTNGVLEDLGQTALPAGHYSQLRLVLADNTGTDPLANAVQPTGGALVALKTPSAQQSGLKLKTSFDVADGGQADLVLDFDACRSVVKAGGPGNYNLRPVLSVSKRVNTSIQGYVTSTLALAATSVSAQQDGVVVRSTAPDASGKFVLSWLPAGNYDVVVTSEGRSTAVVTSVPVTATSTLVNGTATAIVPPASAMRQITGTASVATSGTTTAGPLVADATVRATQALTGGPAIDVARAPVDATLATYTLRVPAGAPMKAPYAPSGPLTFTSDTAVAGKYEVEAGAPERTAVTHDADVGAADLVLDFGFSP